MADKYVQSSPTYELAEGSVADVERIGPQGQLLVDSMHGQMFEASRCGTLFWATNQAAQAISVALATTYTGLCLSNPVGNNRDIIVRAASFRASIAQVALSVVGLLAGYISTGGVTAHTTPLVYGTSMWPMNFGSTAVPTAKVDSAATIVSPKVLMPLIGTVATSGYLAGGGLPVDLQGGLILQPGSYVAMYALTAVTGISMFIWGEITR